MSDRAARWLLILAVMLGMLGIFLLAKDAFAQVEPPEMKEPGKLRTGVVRDKITNVPQQMLGPLPTRIVHYCSITGGAADEIVKLQPIGGGTPSISIAIPAGGLVGKTFNAPVPVEGFEVLTLSPAGDVAVQCSFTSSKTLPPPP